MCFGKIIRLRKIIFFKLFSKKNAKKFVDIQNTRIFAPLLK